MLVRLKADGSVASKGFQANYSRGCGARLVTEGSGALHSPGYPHVMHCTLLCLALHCCAAVVWRGEL